jgi:transcriptional regulator with XRE-family HTH domain
VVTSQEIAPMNPQRRAECIRQFGEAVRARRERLGVTQEDLSFRSGLHRTHIALVEGGRREARLSTICVLALALNVSVSELVCTVPPADPSGS